jgi:hypothetical protein
MRVSKHYRLKRTQAELDFVDVPLNTDLAVFVEPAAIKSLETPWSNQCVALLQDFFSHVLASVRAGDKHTAVRLLSSLSERNEFHLGYSRGRSRGHAFGSGSAGSVWDSLLKSKAARTGVLQDLEDTALLIRGIGPDMISDAVCNIIRGPLIDYTQDMCRYYGIPMNGQVQSGPIWDMQRKGWVNRFVELPVALGEKVILVPKTIVRHHATYDVGDYYRNYLLVELQKQHMAAGTLVTVLKDKSRKVLKKSLKEHYGKTKDDIADVTAQNPNVLAKYKSYKTNNPLPPISNAVLSELELSPKVSLADLLKAVKKIPPGKKYATAYEDAIERLMTALFYPSLSYPQKQMRLHEGRKRLDLTYNNNATEGFFKWLSSHYTAPYVFVECKNYSEEIGNPEFDQLAGRFSPSRGKFGILVCRKVDDRKRIDAACRDTAMDQRGYILVLDDDDLATLVGSPYAIHAKSAISLLTTKFQKLVM